jgi:type I restriction-modification system DNA methylase subunit
MQSNPHNNYSSDLISHRTRNLMPANTTDIEKRLWDAADDLRANSKLKSSEYSMPVLGLIFLRYADYKITSMP